MAARIVEGLFTCAKRWALEKALLAAGHKWIHGGVARVATNEVECVGRILCWLDKRGDPIGRMTGATPADVEFAAWWPGSPGLLYRALVDTGWIDETPEGPRWHDYWSLNGRTIKDRLGMRRMRSRRANAGDNQRDNDRANDVDNERGASGSDSEKTQTQRGVQRGDRRGAPTALLDGASVAPPETDPEFARAADQMGVPVEWWPKLPDFAKAAILRGEPQSTWGWRIPGYGNRAPHPEVQKALDAMKKNPKPAPGV